MIKIKEIREIQGLTAVELAKKMGLDLKTIWRWENGKNAITSDNLILIAKALNCTVDEILGNENTVNKNSLGITPLENKLLQAFRKLSEDDQNKAVGILQALAVMS